MKGIQLFFPLAYEESELLSKYLARIYIYIYNALSHIKIHPPTRPSSRILSLGKSLRPNGFRVNRALGQNYYSARWQMGKRQAGRCCLKPWESTWGLYRDFLLYSLWELKSCWTRWLYYPLYACLLFSAECTPSSRTHIHTHTENMWRIAESTSVER